MQNGIHIIEQKHLVDLRAKGADVPEPWVGVVDLRRMIEGTLDEPPKDQALGIVGLDALLDACEGDVAAVMQGLRRALHAGKHYFEWKKIPVVFLVDGKLEADPAEEILTLAYQDERWELTPLFGRGFKHKDESNESWWWSPQIR